MSHVHLQHTKITIEIEARPLQLPEGSAEPTADKVFPYDVQTRVKVGDQAIGLISTLSLHVGVDHTGMVPDHGLPLIIVDLLGGTAPDPAPGQVHPPVDVQLSPEMVQQLDAFAALLEQFPFVKVNAPKPVPLAP